MALQRKVVTLVEDYTYICQEDDAVHRDHPEFAQKWEHYLDGGEPPLIPGGKPTVFTLRHLNTAAKDMLMPYVSQATDDPTFMTRALTVAFQLGVKAVENYTAKDGRPLAIKAAVDDGFNRVPFMSSDSFNEFEIETVMEVGARVLQRMNPGPK